MATASRPIHFMRVFSAFQAAWVASLLLVSGCSDPGDQPPGDRPPRDTSVADTGDTDDADDTDDTDDTDDPPSADTRIVTAADWLNLRDGPSGDAAVLRALPCGAPVELLGGEEGNWVSVRGEEVEGWVKSSYLALPEDVSDDLCPGPAPYDGEPPGRLVETLSVVPYVEQDCSDITWDGWPYEAKKCTYNGGLKVKVADPSAELVAWWITDAAQMIDALAALESEDRDAWKDGLDIIATHTLTQSSRIFPLEGEIDEGTVYDFDRGVTVGCSTGCYCRINSMTRQMWCEYADKVLGIVDEDDCLDEYTTTSWTDAWAEHCLDNHRAAWTSIHHHYRAMAWWANKSIPKDADATEVLNLLDSLYY